LFGGSAALGLTAAWNARPYLPQFAGDDGSVIDW
jgi:hypothetical protein